MNALWIIACRFCSSVDLPCTIKADRLIACRIIQFFNRIETVHTTYKNLIEWSWKVKVLERGSTGESQIIQLKCEKTTILCFQFFLAVKQSPHFTFLTKQHHVYVLNMLHTGREWKCFFLFLYVEDGQCSSLVGCPNTSRNGRKWLSTPGVGSGNGFSCSNTSGGNLTGLQMLQSTEPHLRTSKE